jgi:hypothetical protein
VGAGGTRGVKHSPLISEKKKIRIENEENIQILVINLLFLQNCILLFRILYDDEIFLNGLHKYLQANLLAPPH